MRRTVPHETKRATTGHGRIDLAPVGARLMDWEAFARHGAEIARWGAAYRRDLRARPVRAQVAPGASSALIPDAPPEDGTAMDAILADLDRVVMPGITHWQHPRFFAYFPANAAPPSILAEMIVAVVAPQCMLWQTSPAATEMETAMLGWLRQAVGLPDRFAGVIQDSASTATLAAVLTMRERALGWAGNRQGLAAAPRIRVYSSGEAHSSVERAVWIAGIGAENLVRIPTAGPRRGLDPAALEVRIAADRASGLQPAGIVASVGGTSTGASDDVAAVAHVASRYGLYLHVDAAWAGAAMICPEFRDLWRGVEAADSVVLNPHKWLGAQFDCSAHFVAEPESLVRTLAIRPDYLRTHGRDGVVDYSEWSIPLGRRFRALKLWFLFRHYGLSGLRTRLRDHVAWAERLSRRLAHTPGFEIVTAPVLSLFTFRPSGFGDAATLDYLERINADGRIYLTQTTVDGRAAIRFQVGQWETTAADVDAAYDVIVEMARHSG
jgi:aromatic-L-amino-acid decarboxylase